MISTLTMIYPWWFLSESWEPVELVVATLPTHPARPGGTSWDPQQGYLPEPHRLASRICSGRLSRAPASIYLSIYHHHHHNHRRRRRNTTTNTNSHSNNHYHRHHHHHHHRHHHRPCMIYIYVIDIYIYGRCRRRKTKHDCQDIIKA